ncbi:MAG: OAM dimerization domain-containing protein [Candidatus Izemoplasma sp.]|nr:OAM dimerization domain-containing protein [Candidatus Izemoplasma sp.]
MGYDISDKTYDKTLDLTRLKPYGDTMNDGRVQLSFTLPIANDEVGEEAAKELAKTMGLIDPLVVASETVSSTFTYYVLYGELSHSIDVTKITVEKADHETLSMAEIDDLIATHFDRSLVVVGASTGTDAHTVGIDAIMNMKGYAGHYGLERYKHIDAYNLGSQVDNEVLIEEALKKEADVILISQTVTQKDVHIKNLVSFIELLEAEKLRERFIVIVGGPRISHKLAKELGFDAGFGPKKYANDVASFFVNELIKKR